MYVWLGHKAEAQRIRDVWNRRDDHSSWNAHMIRQLLVSEMELKLNRGLWLIKTIVAVCPMLG